FTFGRIPWTKHYLTVQTPCVNTKANIVVIMTLPALPHAYIIPFFPKNVQFVSLHAALFDPDNHNTRMQQEIRELIRDHPGPIFHVSKDDMVAYDAGLLHKFGLVYKTRDFQNFSTSFFDIFTWRELTRRAE